MQQYFLYRVAIYGVDGINAVFVVEGGHNQRNVGHAHIVAVKVFRRNCLAGLAVLEFRYHHVSAIAERRAFHHGCGVIVAFDVVHFIVLAAHELEFRQQFDYVACQLD